MTKNKKCFGENTGARAGVSSLNGYSAYVRDGNWWQLAGQEEFLTPGSYTWVCPPGVTKVSACCVGGGGGGYGSWANPAGSGGGLGWKNDIAVTPGSSYTVVVGAQGNRSSSDGGDSYFINRGTVGGGGGSLGNGTGHGIPQGFQYGNNNGGGGYSGDGGGAGGYSSSYQGGGGAGGYTGQGGNGQQNAPNTSGAGAGGQYYSSTHGTGAGGGTGIYGRRTDYNALNGDAYGANNNKGTLSNWNNGGGHGGLGGQGGSRRTGIISGEVTGYSGCSGENPWGFSYNGNDIRGGFPGGGGGGPGTSHGGGHGGMGAVRLMWAGERANTNRSYPDTNCEDVT